MTSGSPGTKVSRAEGGVPGPRSAAVRREVTYCLAVFLAVRVALSGVGLVGVALLPDLSGLGQGARAGLPPVPYPVGVPGWPAHPVTPGWHNLVTAFERQDALWYLRIAARGYSPRDGSAAFFPLYPLSVRAVSFLLGGHPLAAGLVVSNLAFLLALVLLYRLTGSELSESVARRAVLYTAVFPTAFFFLAPYSESLFLLAVLASFLAARRGRWEAAGLAGALAALTRSVGMVMVLALAAEAVLQGRARGRWFPLQELAWSAAPALGTLAFLGYWRAASGDWLAPLHRQATWQRAPTSPLVTAARATREAFRYIGLYPGGYHLLDWLIAVPVVVAAGYAALRFRPSYGTYAWASILVPLALPFPGRPLLSFSRFVLPIFPVFWGFARWTEGHPGRHQLYLGISAGLLGLMTLLFVNWYYVL